MIKFTKMHGLGNDYVYIDCVRNELDIDFSSLAKKISDRHFGVGSDGLILICKSDLADFRMRMFNFDGSEAEMCGNGIRCVGKYVYDNRLTEKEDISIETLAGIKYLKLNVVDSKVESVCVDMGEPILDEKLIPSLSSKFNLSIDDKNFSITCVSMGNPHAVIVVDNITDDLVLHYGKLIESDNHFPNRTNVEFIEIIDRNHINMRVFERGAGETFACGTGACASVVACILNGLVDRNVIVTLLGGDLSISWNQNNHVYMTGPATCVFDGVYYE